MTSNSIESKCPDSGLRRVLMDDGILEKPTTWSSSFLLMPSLCRQHIHAFSAKQTLRWIPTDFHCCVATGSEFRCKQQKTAAIISNVHLFIVNITLSCWPLLSGSDLEAGEPFRCLVSGSSQSPWSPVGLPGGEGYRPILEPAHGGIRP